MVFEELMARLRREVLSAPDIHGGRRMVPLNPDGPDAISAIATLQARLVEVEKERDAANESEWHATECFKDANARALAAEQSRDELAGALRKLANAAARLSVAAQTTGGVAGRDEGLCAEIDRLAQPLGAARSLIEALDKGGGEDEPAKNEKAPDSQ